MAQKIQPSQLAPFAPCTIRIRGKVSYSHLTHHVEGKELDDINKSRAAKGYTQINKPYTALNITDAYIIDDNLNPLVKEYFENKIKSVINDDGTTTNIYYGTSKSPFLPTIVYGREAGELAGQGIADNDVPLENELARGLDVTIGAKLFKVNTNVGVPVGIGIDYILVNEPIQYYVSNSIQEALAAEGITKPYVKPKPHEETVTEETAPVNTQPIAVNPMNSPIPQVDNNQMQYQQPTQQTYQQVPPQAYQQTPQPQPQPQAQPQQVYQQTPQPQQTYQQAPQGQQPIQANPINSQPQANQAAVSPMVNIQPQGQPQPQPNTYPQGGANYGTPDNAPSLSYNPN